MKKAFVIMVLLVICIDPAFAINDEAKYIVENNILIKYLGSESEVVIPGRISGERIIEIADGAFEGRDIVSVEIQEGTEIINQNAFLNCKQLEKVVFPESMFTVHDYAFKGCYQLNDVIMKNMNTLLNPYSFENAGVRKSKLLNAKEGIENGFIVRDGIITSYLGNEEYVTIPASVSGETVTQIGDSVFENNETIRSIDIPGGISVIGKNSFRGCSNLSNVTVQEGLKKIGDYAFEKCTSLEYISLPHGLTVMGNNTFQGCSKLKEARIPEGVSLLGNYAFYNCKELESISVPDSITSIGIWAFGYCSKMKEFIFKNNLKSIQSAAFYGCSSLPAASLSDSVTELGTHCFRGCSGIVVIKLPNNISAIPYRGFDGCRMSELVIPASVKVIYAEAFYNTLNLKQVVFLGEAPQMQRDIFVNANAALQFVYDTKSGTYQNKAVISDGFTITNGLVCMGEADIYLWDSQKSKTLVIGIYQQDKLIGLSSVQIRDFLLNKSTKVSFTVNLMAGITDCEKQPLQNVFGLGSSVKLFVWDTMESLAPIAMGVLAA